MKHTRLPAYTPLLIALPLLATGCLSSLSHDPALTARWDEILSRLDDTGAIVTARVLELPSRRELYARDIDKPYTPASNAKLPVSAAGLDMFGLDHTFKTYLAVDGNDLWVIGTGDPGIGDPRLAKRAGGTITSVFDEWADALAARGQTQFGDIYYYDDALDKEWLHPSWGEDVLHWYGAPTSGLNFNDNCVDITIHPTTPGQPVRYDLTPPCGLMMIINECVTADEHAPTIEKLPDIDTIRIAGTCSKTAELKSKPVMNPGVFFCDAFRTHLAGRGMTVTGEIKHTPTPLGDDLVPPADKLVATHETDVRGIIDRINTNSQNFFAEAFCKLTGQAWAARQGRHVPGSWTDGEQAIREFLRANNIDDRHYVAADGSGLSDLNKLTSRLVTDLLAVMMERPDGHAYLDSQAKGGINGSLEKRFADSEGHVFAKTGYIGGVRALSGYVRTRDNRWLTFSIIYNQIPGSVKPYEQLQDEAVKLLIDWPNIHE